MESIRYSSVGRAVALLAVMAAAGCEETSTKIPLVRYDANDRVYGEVAIAGQHAVRSASAAGPVTLEGENLDVVRWYVYRYTSAPTQAEATAALSQIVPTYATVADTMVFDVRVPVSGQIAYNGALTLGVPGNLACDVENARAPVRASNLFNDLTVRGSDSLTVLHHTGSVDAALSPGHITIEAAVPASGACTATTENGNIELRLPPGTSATLIARTLEGSVTVSGLSLTDRTDSTGFVSGTLGGGSAPIRLETKKGNITVKGL